MVVGLVVDGRVRFVVFEKKKKREEVREKYHPVSIQ